MTFEEMETVFKSVSKKYSIKLISGNPQQLNSQFHMVDAGKLSKALDAFKALNKDVALTERAEKLRETYFNKISERIATKMKRRP